MREGPPRARGGDWVSVALPCSVSAVVRNEVAAQILEDPHIASSQQPLPSELGLYRTRVLQGVMIDRGAGMRSTSSRRCRAKPHLTDRKLAMHLDGGDPAFGRKPVGRSRLERTGPKKLGDVARFTGAPAVCSWAGRADPQTPRVRPHRAPLRDHQAGLPARPVGGDRGGATRPGYQPDAAHLRPDRRPARRHGEKLGQGGGRPRAAQPRLLRAALPNRGLGMSSDRVFGSREAARGLTATPRSQD